MQTEQQSLRAAAGQRFWQIDALRGLALLNMLVYHAMYDWVYIFGHASGWYDIWSTHCHVWQQYICWSFILLSGYSFTLSRRPLKNGLLTAACAVVFLGVLCFFLESLGGGHLSGDLLALLSGLTYGCVFMLNDMPDGDPISSVFWSAVMSTVIGLPQLVQQPRLEGTALISMLVLGVFQMGLAFVFLTMGLKTTPSITASLVTGIEPVLNPILVAVFYHEYMGVLSIIGAFIVIIGVVGYNVLKEKQEQKIKLEEDIV